MLRAIKNKIIFKFIQEIVNKNFNNVRQSGLIINNPVNDVKTPRWGKVVSVGPDVENIYEGDYILIEPLMWTEAMKYSDEKVWATSSEKIIGVTKEEPIGFV